MRMVGARVARTRPVTGSAIPSSRAPELRVSCAPPMLRSSTNPDACSPISLSRVASLARATLTCVRALATQFARGLHRHLPSLNQRAQGIPGACCTRGLACDLRKEICTRAYRAAGAIRHSLRNGFTAYCVLFPANDSFASRRRARHIPPLTPAPRRPRTATTCRTHPARRLAAIRSIGYHRGSREWLTASIAAALRGVALETAHESSDR